MDVSISKVDREARKSATERRLAKEKEREEKQNAKATRKQNHIDEVVDRKLERRIKRNVRQHLKAERNAYRQGDTYGKAHHINLSVGYRGKRWCDSTSGITSKVTTILATYSGVTFTTAYRTYRKNDVEWVNSVTITYKLKLS